MNNSQLMDKILECSYPPNTKDYIGTNILELYTIDKTTSFYKVMVNNEKIIVANFKLKVFFKEKSYDVPVLIYFPKLFPKVAPELYIEHQPSIGVNPKNLDIDQNTKRVFLGSLKGWNLYSTIKGVIED